ncbi:MAG: SDR family oxidoreductase [Dolichospermum sp. DET50]|nr:SDR family oxidoreductase [Dolichospermum sp. DET66]MBS3034086.1 SDR family oxidoreductase [Dolichospermum sp. DET67]MBS3039289.1 SDR family oxidoreductase [Dolichospermum sp. DET50]QSX66516.1 MAG: SDR family oxidoreductase [Dolichospermum sp. DET69]
MTTLFITGSTGFLGTDLIKEFYKIFPEDKFYLLVRNIDNAKEIFKDLNQERITYVEGDITLPNLGIKSHIDIDQIWHLAASTSFQDSKYDQTKETNTLGTENIINFANKIPHLKNFFYMSTAYISGKTLEEVPENRFEPTEGFNNPYEETKNLSEKIVYESKLPITIIRPSIIMGDSKTYTAKKQTRMVYGYALTLMKVIISQFGSQEKFLKHLKYSETELELNIRLIGSPEITKNLIPINEVINACVDIKKSCCLGKTYNLVNPKNISVGEITEIIQKNFKVRGMYHDSTATKESLKASKSEKIAYRYTEIYHPYMQIQEPLWKQEEIQRIGTKISPMTKELFDKLMNQFIKEEILKEY